MNLFSFLYFEEKHHLNLKVENVYYFLVLDVDLIEFSLSIRCIMAKKAKRK